jgi:hypothetical protein
MSVISYRSLSSEARIQTQATPCGIYGGQSDFGTFFYPIPSEFLCQYYYMKIVYKLLLITDAM